MPSAEPAHAPHLSLARAEKALVVFGAVSWAIADDVEPSPRIR